MAVQDTGASRAGRLEGKVAVITGTAGGQGRAAALRFAQEGAAVVGCDLKVDEAQETVDLVVAGGGRMISHHPLDLTVRDGVASWIDAAVQEYGGIDILYNNAAWAAYGGIADLSIEDWNATLRGELDMVFHATQCAWPHLVARGAGVIINTASVQGINAIQQGSPGFAHAAGKHGVIGMTRQLAYEGGPHNIRVNAISPAFIESPATADLSAIPGYHEALLDAQIIRRVGQPEDIVGAALFFASDESSFITGQNLIVDGGYTVI